LHRDFSDQVGGVTAKPGICYFRRSAIGEKAPALHKQARTLGRHVKHVSVISLKKDGPYALQRTDRAITRFMHGGIN
jgi:hypothetical protein